MALNLLKQLLSIRLRPCSGACCIVQRKCEPYTVSPGIWYEKATNQWIATQTKPLFQNEATVSKNGKLYMPVLKGNGLPKDSAENIITSEDIALIKKTETDALEPCKEDISDIGPFALPSFTLAAFVNTSFTLQQFVLMGVRLHVIEKKKDVAEYILKLDFEKHVKPYLRFLHDIGVPGEELGNFVTKNPMIFQQDLDDLQVRINYLEAKKFTVDGISRIVVRNPNWLNFSTVDIDKRLGFFQRTFILSGDEVRMLAVKRPTLITYDLGKVTVSNFAVKEEMGFNSLEAKTLLLNKPKIFNIQTKSLVARFNCVHNVMGISHEQILQQPSILTFREYIIKQRHEFLKQLGKAQYDPKLPNYVSLDTLVKGNDVDFCSDVAKTSIEVFNAFLKAN